MEIGNPGIFGVQSIQNPLIKILVFMRHVGFAVKNNVKVIASSILRLLLSRRRTYYTYFLMRTRYLQGPTLIHQVYQPK
ncbi:unnamed protein product [Victoria cruziana]